MKSWWKSKTIWFNILAVVALITTSPQVLAAVPADWMPYLVAAQSTINIVLRVVTNTGISSSKS